MKRIFLFAPLALAGCDVIDQYAPRERTAAPASIETGQPPPPPPDARTVEEFDTTTPAERQAASAPVSGGALLGTTVASLGDAGSPGFWIETPLVSAPGKGKLRYPQSGRSVEVELRPSPGGSSRVSLAALRLLNAPLTELVTLEVYGS
jgi:hypothetical protein